MQRRIHSALKSKIHPLLHRKVHHNLQDVCLLLSADERKGNVLEALTSLVHSQTKCKAILERWVNHLLRLHERDRKLYGQSSKAR